MSKIKVGAVSYLNTKPLIYGFSHGYSLDDMELIEDYPARVAEMLLNDEIDLGLVPVAIIPKLKEHHIVSDYCIGADGPVASVGLYSEVSIDKVERVLLDYQSRTSVELAKILLKHYWKIDPELVAASENFQNEIGGTTAAVVIGDRAFEQRLKSKFTYDLAEAWKDFAGLPFVFAAWISNKKLSPSFVKYFNEANRVGLENLDDVLRENPYDTYDLRYYFTTNMSYTLNAEKQKGLNKFLELL